MTPNSEDFKHAKKALRSSIKSQLSRLSTQAITSQSALAQNLVLNHPQYKSAKRVGIYLSMPQGEAQTELLIKDALAEASSASPSERKKVFVPYIYSVTGKSAEGQMSKPKKRKVMDMMRLGSWEEYVGLERDGWGIPKLGEEGMGERENAICGTGLYSEEDDRTMEGGGVDGGKDDGGLDLIIVPAVAFDRSLNRMGHGAGFYDRYLTRCFGNGWRKRPFLLGLCLADQIVPDGHLVMEPWDWKVDAVAVGDGTLLT